MLTSLIVAALFLILIVFVVEVRAWYIFGLFGFCIFDCFVAWIHAWNFGYSWTEFLLLETGALLINGMLIAAAINFLSALIATVRLFFRGSIR